jgi:restriction system protein
MDTLIEYSQIRLKHTVTGRHSGFIVDLYHRGLQEYKHLSASDRFALEGKIENQKIAWDTRWEKEKHRQAMQSKESLANEQTKKAHEAISSVEQILHHTLAINDAVDWESLKFFDKFSKSSKGHSFFQYKGNGYPKYAILKDFPAKPRREDYFETISFFSRFIGKAKSIKDQQANAFEAAQAQHEKMCRSITLQNQKHQEKLVGEQEQWEAEKMAFEAQQTIHNLEIDRLKRHYLEAESDAILEYCEMVLNNSIYPQSFPKKFDLQYIEENQTLLVDYQLPTFNDMPKIASCRYVKSRNVIEEKMLTRADQAKLYDSAIYQIVIRTLHELFEADVGNFLSAAIVNGIVVDVNPATGHSQSLCIVSVHANKVEFEKISLEGIVAAKTFKECFKALRGIGSAKLSGLTPVAPVMELNKSDRRFTDHYQVADTLNDTINIASMPWEDFEHLVRELFAKEFSQNGGEVKITQASRDGGVDAVAFDPDPVRGGKIVIQAKRYTNVVGVSAVRDLYGTMMSEGAMKGILVTTSEYGSDSYEFAKGKPLTLLNGSNLLHLLSKHGHKARIDVKEAKQILKNDI